MSIVLRAGDLNRRVRIERPVAGPGFDDAGNGEWAPVATVAANVQDALPSHGERLADGLNASARPARIRIRFRRDVTSSMRFCVLRQQGVDEVVDRILQIVSGPAELGERVGLEFMAEEYSPAGNTA
jgi:head-tail adaptor